MNKPNTRCSQNSRSGAKLNMLYLIEITKLNGKAFFGAAVFGTAETLPVSGKRVGKNGGRSLRAGAFYIKKY